MTKEQALHAIAAHHDRGIQEHHPWTSPTKAVEIMNLRVQRIANHIYNNGSDYDMNKAARRALQLAALCVRFVVDLDLDQGNIAQEER